MGLFSFLVNRLQRKRYAIQSMQKTNYLFGSIYSFRVYSNWKHDPSPLVWCQYGGQKTGYFHGINLHYLDYSEKQWLARAIYLIVRGNQVMDGYTFYKFLKMNKMSIVKKAYRTYFTNKIIAPRLVAHGINTVVYKMTYPFNDPYIKNLNKITMPSDIPKTPSISYSSTELSERVIEASNAINITKQTVSPTGTAAYTQKPGWMK